MAILLTLIGIESRSGFVFIKFSGSGNNQSGLLLLISVQKRCESSENIHYKPNSGEGEVCRVDSDAPSKGSTICRQKYARYELLAIDKDGNDIIDFFRLPSACICHHKRGNSNFESFDLFGLRIANTVLPVCKIKDSGIK